MASGETPLIVKVLFLLAGIGALLIIILVPISFGNVEYYQYGFARRKSTGTVDLNQVYTSGKYMIGPDFEFKTFKADAHFVTLSVSAFTADRLEVSVRVHFQYFLRYDDLPALHDAYDVYYEDVMKPSAIDALKGAVVIYNTREIFSRFREVEKTLFTAVRNRLGGICCQRDCSSWEYACSEGCKERSSCDGSDHGLFVNVKYFQLGRVYLPEDVTERYLRSLVLKEETEREQLSQDAQVERKRTQSMVQQIKNEAGEIKQEAESTSSLISAQSRANYTAIVDSARSQGLSQLYTKMGISSQEHKNSFDYLRTLRGHENVHFTVDYQQNIVGTLPYRK